MKNFRQISKFFIVGIKDFQWSAEVDSFLDEYPIAGLALFNSPHDNPSNIWKDRDGASEAVYEFSTKALARQKFIACDQEGGRVRRLRPPFVALPSAEKLVEASDSRELLDKIRELYCYAARQMALTGVTLDFAPVCDLRLPESNKVIGDRSFGSNRKEVLPFVKVFCEAFENEGVRTTLKHFPGHGPTKDDSHDRVARIFKSKDDFFAEDLPIFLEAHEFASAIMTAHIAFEEEPDRILSLDLEYQRDLRMGFSKKVAWITDDLQTMKAVSERQPWLKAFDCQYDFLLLCGDLDQAANSIEQTIRYAESKRGGFQDELDLEKRIHRSESLFAPTGGLLKYEMWKSKILEYEEKSNQILEKLSLS